MHEKTLKDGRVLIASDTSDYICSYVRYVILMQANLFYLQKPSRLLAGNSLLVALDVLYHSIGKHALLNTYNTPTKKTKILNYLMSESSMLLLFSHKILG